jgi:GGDEF domain-containing protein
MTTEQIERMVVAITEMKSRELMQLARILASVDSLTAIMLRDVLRAEIGVS